MRSIAAIIGMAVLAGCSSTSEPSVAPSSGPSASPSATPLELSAGVEKLGDLPELGSRLKIPKVATGTIVIAAECFGRRTPKTERVGEIDIDPLGGIGIPCRPKGAQNTAWVVFGSPRKNVVITLQRNKTATTMRAVVGWTPTIPQDGESPEGVSLVARYQ